MFGRRAGNRLKNAEEALAAGRLDEAFSLADSPDVAGLGGAERVLTAMVEALLRRGQDYLMSRRFGEALADFDRAARCGQDIAKVAEWQRRAREALNHDLRLNGEQNAALAAGNNRLAAGSLAGAKDARDRAPLNDTAAEILSQAIERQADRAKGALEAAAAALKESDFIRASRELRTARSLHSKADELAELETRLLENVMRQVTESFKEGRLNRARQELAILGDLGRERPDRIEIDSALKLAADAAKALAEDHYVQAGVLLGRLCQLGLTAKWIGEAREHLDVLDEHRRALLEGPLGLLAGRDVTRPGVTDQRVTDQTVSARPRRIDRIDHAPLVVSPAAEQGILPRRLLLRIDGVGSFLLIRGDRITIGRAGGGADLELLSDLAERQAEVIRAAEDYFVVATSGVELAGRRVDHALLQDGDRLALGKRVRLTFRRPSLKSTTAALDLGEGVRTAGDCRRVILWSGPLLLGNSGDCHIRLPVGGLIFMERAGAILVRPVGPGQPLMTTLPLGVTTTVGELDMRVQSYNGGSGGGVGRVIG